MQHLIIIFVIVSSTDTIRRTAAYNGDCGNSLSSSECRTTRTTTSAPFIFNDQLDDEDNIFLLRLRNGKKSHKKTTEW